jgi:hypothetical protein
MFLVVACEKYYYCLLLRLQQSSPLEFRANLNLSIQERAGKLVVALAAGDVSVGIVEARSHVANVLGRLSRDLNGEHGGRNLEMLVVLADVLEHSAISEVITSIFTAVKIIADRNCNGVVKFSTVLTDEPTLVQQVTSKSTASWSSQTARAKRKTQPI